MLDDAMDPSTPDAAPYRDHPVRLMILLALPMLMAFATGVLATLVFAGGPLAERKDQEVAALLDELHQVRRSEAWLTTLAAQYIQSTEVCESAAAGAAGAAQVAEPGLLTARAGLGRTGGAQ